LGSNLRSKEPSQDKAGNQRRVVWTHGYYGDPKFASSGNTLYILRLVITNEAAASKLPCEGRKSLYDGGQREIQVDQLKAVLQMAQAEAAEWKSGSVNLWDFISLEKAAARKTCWTRNLQGAESTTDLREELRLCVAQKALDDMRDSKLAVLVVQDQS